MGAVEDGRGSAGKGGWQGATAWGGVSGAHICDDRVKVAPRRHSLVVQAKTRRVKGVPRGKSRRPDKARIPTSKWARRSVRPTGSQTDDRSRIVQDETGILPETGGITSALSGGCRAAGVSAGASRLGTPAVLPEVLPASVRYRPAWLFREAHSCPRDSLVWWPSGRRSPSSGSGAGAVGCCPPFRPPSFPPPWVSRRSWRCRPSKPPCS